MKKKDIKLDFSTKVSIKTLEYWEQQNPGKFIIKDKLFPMIVRRADSIMDTNWEDFFGQAISPPDEKYLRRSWKLIRNHAAKAYRKFIVWDSLHRTGTRLGTFEEYQLIPDILLNIVIGICDSEEDTANIIKKIDPSTDVFLISAQLKQLPAGEK